jgi:hypothetical protein
MVRAVLTLRKKFAYTAPEFGIYVPPHPLDAEDSFLKSYAKDLANMPERPKGNIKED